MTEQEQLDRDQKIADYKRVESFLADPAVKSAIKRVSDSYYAQFGEPLNEEELKKLHAKARALNELSGELLAVMNVGKAEQILKVREEEREAQKQSRRK